MCVPSMAPAHIGKPHLSLYDLIMRRNSSSSTIVRYLDFNCLKITSVTLRMQIEINALETPNRLAGDRYPSVEAIKTETGQSSLSLQRPSALQYLDVLCPFAVHQQGSGTCSWRYGSFCTIHRQSKCCMPCRTKHLYVCFAKLFFPLWSARWRMLEELTWT